MTMDEARQIVKDHTRHLVDKWSKTGLLDGLHNDIEKSNMSVLIESEEKRILVSEMTEEQRRLDQAMRMVSNIKL